MALLRILDATDPATRMALEAAIRANDPGADIAPDWERGVVEVRGAIPVESLCVALRLAGYRVERLMQRPRAVRLADVLMLGLQTVVFAIIGGIVGAILGGVLGFLYTGLNPSCGSVLEGGPCTTVVLRVGVAAALIGVLVGAVVTLIVGGMRLAHLHRTGEDVPFLRL